VGLGTPRGDTFAVSRCSSEGVAQRHAGSPKKEEAHSSANRLRVLAPALGEARQAQQLLPRSGTGSSRQMRRKASVSACHAHMGALWDMRGAGGR